MAQSQASHSLQSITDPHAPAASGERKISFVLQDNESNESAEKHVNFEAIMKRESIVLNYYVITFIYLG